MQEQRYCARSRREMCTVGGGRREVDLKNYCAGMGKSRCMQAKLNVL